ncbi:MAG: type II toxin-antitoxin system VapC family toxin [Chthoniobacterales bacterium]
MILLDTNVVIDAHYGAETESVQAGNLISSAVINGGAGINSITLAELYAGPARGETIEQDMNQSGIAIFDLPLAAAAICGRAYRRYLLARRKSRGGEAPAVPLPDFFIGAHAELMGWPLATRDTDRYRLYFPRVELIGPQCRGTRGLALCSSVATTSNQLPSPALIN